MSITGDYIKPHLKSINDPLPKLKSAFDLEEWLLSRYITQRMDELGMNSLKIADFGCGTGRPMIALAQRFPQNVFMGFDNDPNMIAAAYDRVNAPGLLRVNSSFHEQDVLLFAEQSNDRLTKWFDVIYSAYNTIGSFTDAERRRFILAQKMLTASGGYIINGTWSRDKSTTAFLKQYYPHIGIRINQITPDFADTDYCVFKRLDPDQLHEEERQQGIIPECTIHAGVWTFVIGKVE